MLQAFGTLWHWGWSSSSLGGTSGVMPRCPHAALAPHIPPPNPTSHPHIPPCSLAGGWHRRERPHRDHGHEEQPGDRSYQRGVPAGYGKGGARGAPRGTGTGCVEPSNPSLWSFGRWIRSWGAVLSFPPPVRSLPQAPGGRPELRHLGPFQEDSRLPGSGTGGSPAGGGPLRAAGGGLGDAVWRRQSTGSLGGGHLLDVLSVISVSNHRATAMRGRRTSPRRTKMPR